MVYMYSIDDLVDDALPPIDDVKQISVELSKINTRNYKREAGSIIIVIKDILDTFYISTKTDVKRPQIEEKM